MFCRNCGSRIVGEGKYCSGCGTEIVHSSIAAPAAVSASVGHRTPAVKERSWTESFRDGWREFFGSPLVLATIIVFSVMQLFNLFAIGSSMSELNSSMEALGVGGEIVAEAFSGIEILTVLGSIPGILMVVGMWIVYADSKSYASQPIQTAGLSLILGVQIVQIVSLVLMFFMALSAFGEMEAALSDYGSIEASAAFSAAGSVLFFAVVIGGAIYGFFIHVVNKMKSTANDCEPSGHGAAFGAGVLFIVFGAISVFALFGAGITLGGALDCACPIMLGAVLCQYKTKMDELDNVRAAMHAGAWRHNNAKIGAYPNGQGPNPNARKPVQTQTYIPAWKRVQMAKEQQGEQELELKPEPVQPQVKPAIKCPECGTTQSGDNYVCVLCGADL